jgi:uncharacterized protein (TIGR03437 family)
MFDKLRAFILKNRFALALGSALTMLLVSSLEPASERRRLEAGGALNYCQQIACQILGIFVGNFGGSGGSSYVLNSNDYNNLRLEPNVGQADPGYRYLAHGAGQKIYLSSGEAVFEFEGRKLWGLERREVHAALVGANQAVDGLAQEPKSGRVNYLIGNDPQKWHTNIPTFGRVTFHSVYPGIDVVYRGAGRLMENDFMVSPGADPATIRIRFAGADEVRIDSDGALIVEAGKRALRWQAPEVYQQDEHGRRDKIEGRFALPGRDTVAFEIGVYDLHRTLVIDPLVTYATYFGGPTGDGATRVVADAGGNAYMIGATDSEDFQSSPGTFATSGTGVNGNVLVAKLGPDGKTMIYETHIGGSGGDVGLGIALDATGNVYLTGMTASADYPLVPATNNLTTKSVTDPDNCFVTKLNASGSALVYSNVLGGSQQDACTGVGVDASGNAYVVGATASTDFPTMNALQPAAPSALFGNPSVAAFAAKLNPAGTALLYSTYYGGTGTNVATQLAVDSSGNVYFTGCTTSTSFPITSGAFQTTFAGSGGQNSQLAPIFPSTSIFGNVLSAFGDAFVVKLNSSGQRVYATYLGGQQDDIGFGIAIDSKGDAYVGGATLSKNFPMQNAFQSAYHGAGGNTQVNAGDGFIAELNPAGTALLFSSYIGGSKDDRVLGVALDSSGNIYLAGHTLSADFPTAGQQAQSGYAGDSDGFFATGDAFLAEVSTSYQLTSSTFFGGSAGDWAGGVAVDGLGGVIIVGSTDSPDFPATSGSYQTKYAGSDSLLAGVAAGDAFLVRFGGGIPAVSISGISNAASYVGGAIAPGEAVLISGSGIGPATLTTAQCTTSACTNLSTMVSNTQFTFNGVPAPIVYVSQQYSSVIVPYEVAASSTAQVIATVNGVPSPAFTVAVVKALPGIFTANSSGTGLAAIRNQNGSTNSAQSPAPPGSLVTLYLTGEGQTVPPGVDGQVTSSLTTQPALSPVTVMFGNAPATNYQYVGEAPGVVAGVLQINVTVPQLAPAGNAVPLVVNVGSFATPNGVTIAIQ